VLIRGGAKHKPVLCSPSPSQRKWILMMDFASTHAQAKEVAPPTSRKGGQADATATMPLSASPPLAANGVDKIYCELGEIHDIATAQLACTR
jgi:hypothetical protein